MNTCEAWCENICKRHVCHEVNRKWKRIDSLMVNACDFSPKLTNEEQCLLMEHKGCLECCKFYAGHRASQCSTVTSGKGYKPLTMQDADHAKAIRSSKGSSTSNSNTIAAITDVSSPSQTKDFIATYSPLWHLVLSGMAVSLKVPITVLLLWVPNLI